MSLLAFLRNSMSSFQEPSMLKVQIMWLFANSNTLTARNSGTQSLMAIFSL